MDNQISPLAFVDPSAKIGNNVKIYPFAFIDKDVVIGDNSVVMSHATILEGVVIGKQNYIYQNAVVGAVPQSFRFKVGHRTKVVIGDNNRIRENVVIAGSLDENSATIIGDNNFLMDGVHVCHDVHIGNDSVLGIHAQVSGDCILDDSVILSSNALIQHRVHIGSYALVQSGCRVHRDIPPYIILGGNPATYHGINSTVLCQQKESDRILRHIANAYRLIYSTTVSLEDALIRIKEQIPQSEEIDYIVSFINSSKRGITGRTIEE